MTNYKSLLTILFSVFILGACNSHFDSSETVNGIYSNDKIGWKIKVPEGWKQLPNEHRERWTDLTLFKYSASGLREGFVHTLGIYKGEEDVWNTMITNMEPMTNLPNATEAKILEQYMTALSNGYNSMILGNLNIGSSIDTIDGKKFTRLNVDLYSKKKELIFSQIIYLKIIGGHLFEVIITYNNMEDRRTMLKAFMNSTFSKND